MKWCDESSASQIFCCGGLPTNIRLHTHAHTHKGYRENTYRLCGQYGVLCHPVCTFIVYQKFTVQSYRKEKGTDKLFEGMSGKSQNSCFCSMALASSSLRCATCLGKCHGWYDHLRNRGLLSCVFAAWGKLWGKMCRPVDCCRTKMLVWVCVPTVLIRVHAFTIYIQLDQSW